MAPGLPSVKNVRKQLVDAMRRRRFIRFSRRFEESPVKGYVLDVGPRYFLLALVSDRLWFDGFECFRLVDVHDVQPDPYAAFVTAALRKRRERRPRKPSIRIGRMDELLLSAGRAFPLITIHREEIDDEACWIGRVLRVERGHLSLLEIDPGAKWRREPTDFRTNEITRVNFGGDYEDALHAVGGHAPRVNVRSR